MPFSLIFFLSPTPFQRFLSSNSTRTCHQSWPADFGLLEFTSYSALEYLDLYGNSSQAR